MASCCTPNVRMSDVAALAGVATMTVSRVLSGHASVSDDTRRRVHRAVEQLHYHPDLTASALRGSRSHTIGVLLPSLLDSRCSAVLQGINEVLFARGYSVTLGSTGAEPQNAREEALKLVRRRVDGFIVMPAMGKSQIGGPEFQGVRIVNVGVHSAGSSPDSVAVEQRYGCYLAVKHLQQHGHRRVLFLGQTPRFQGLQQLVAGYRKAMDEAGLKSEAHFHCSSVESVAAILKAGYRSKDRATAVVASDQLVALHVVRALKELGIRVPKQIALVACDDFDAADLLLPSLTAVSQPVYRMGREAAGLLLSRLDGKQPAISHMVLASELVVRQSCGCAGRAASTPSVYSDLVSDLSTISPADADWQTTRDLHEAQYAAQAL